MVVPAPKVTVEPIIEKGEDNDEVGFWEGLVGVGVGAAATGAAGGAAVWATRKTAKKATTRAGLLERISAIDELVAAAAAATRATIPFGGEATDEHVAALISAISATRLALNQIEDDELATHASDLLRAGQHVLERRSNPTVAKEDARRAGNAMDCLERRANTLRTGLRLEAKKAA